MPVTEIGGMAGCPPKRVLLSVSADVPLEEIHHWVGTVAVNGILNLPRGVIHAIVVIGAVVIVVGYNVSRCAPLLNDGSVHPPQNVVLDDRTRSFINHPHGIVVTSALVNKAVMEERVHNDVPNAECDLKMIAIGKVALDVLDPAVSCGPDVDVLSHSNVVGGNFQILNPGIGGS